MMELEKLQIDAECTAETISAFIAAAIENPGLDGAVIALSGGIDSAVSAYLTARAIGPERFRAFNMPYASSNPDSQAHAQLVADDLGIEFEVIDITQQIDLYFERYPDADHIRRGNKMARERMSIIYDMAKVHHAMVIGTGNRTEAMLGYTTMWGDMAAGIVPIGNLYKTQVRQLAAHLGVPQAIIAKPPSADLWSGQTDEGELGLTYEQADWILYSVLDEERDPDAIASDMIDADAVRKVLALVERNGFKRVMPPACDVSKCWGAG
jgi:NAD+ synthase